MDRKAYYIGIDVGTGSARAAAFDSSGRLVSSAVKNIETWRSEKDHRIFEQSTEDIWAAICHCVSEVLARGNLDNVDVKGVGFDATCSLAVVDERGTPICVTDGVDCGNHGDRNVILWADHRAEQEAALINGTGSVVLDYVGGKMSLEMEIPKILWLKHHMSSERFTRCQFFDLPDFLTYRATGSLQRSSCSLVCKCSYLPHKGWQADFFEEIGLGELVHTHYRQLGEGDVLTAGSPVGSGLTAHAAHQLGLVEGTAVGSAVIDAYAGWIGTIAARYKQPDGGELSPVVTIDESRHRVAAVAGTSTCYLVQSPQGIPVPGVWGPYGDAIFPGWWMNEGGQSSTGQLIDFIIASHPAYPKLKAEASRLGISIHECLEQELKIQQIQVGASSVTEVVKDLHVYPDFHGNRSPISDSNMKGSMMGLTLDESLGDLARKYWAVLEAIALQTRHILEEMNGRGHDITEIYMSGGQVKNFALMQLLAATCSCPVVLPHSHSTAVVLGSAILGKFAAEHSRMTGRTSDELWNVMTSMTPPGTIITPSADASTLRLLQAKYKIFKENIDIQLRWREDIRAALSSPPNRD